MKKQHLGPYVAFLLLTAAVGGLGALVVNAGMPAYQALEKPCFTPPDAAFPIAWSILYLLMAVSAARVWNTRARHRDRAIRLFSVQLAMNFLWNVWFFTLHWFLFAFLWLLALIAVIWLMIRSFSRLDAPAGRLQIPYLLWCCFAAALNLGIALLN